MSLIRRVADRWLLSSAALAEAAHGVLPAFDEGDMQPALDFLEALMGAMGLVERDSDVTLSGKALRIEADWYYALGSKNRNQVNGVIRDIRETQRSLVYWRGKGVPKQTSLRRVLQRLIDFVPWLKSWMRDVSDETPHGNFTLVQMRGVSKKDWGTAIEALDKAADILGKKFPKLVYGKVYITTTQPGRTVASYMPNTDVIYLSLKAKRTLGDIRALLHEFGHRYYYKFWRDKVAKNNFMLLSLDPVYEVIPVSGGQKRALADEYLQYLRDMRAGRPNRGSDFLFQYVSEINKSPSLQRKMRELSQKALAGGETEEQELHKAFLWGGPDEIHTGKVIRKPIAVTPYGGTDVQENFCEAFALYLLNEPLHPEIQRVMESLR